MLEIKIYFINNKNFIVPPGLFIIFQGVLNLYIWILRYTAVFNYV